MQEIALAVQRGIRAGLDQITRDHMAEEAGRRHDSKVRNDRRRKRREEELDEHDPPHSAWVADHAEAIALLDEVEHELARMPPKRRLAYQLIFLCRMGQKEAAEQMGVRPRDIRRYLIPRRKSARTPD